MNILVLNAYLKLAAAALMPVAAAVILYLLEKKTAFGSLPKAVRQGIYGVVFGALAVVGTEWGIPLNGAQVNCRDSSVIIAGLMFGAPAGIIAGVIGGVERWIAVAWGVGTFTRLACTVSTIIAGIYAAALRKYMFEDKKPGVFISFACGVVMEVFHLTMVFITNMATPERAMEVVKVCTVPMLIANGASVMLAAIAVAALGRESAADGKGNARISQTIQRWMLLAVVFAFTVTSYFVFRLQDEIAVSQENTLLSIALEETAADINDASDWNLLSITHRIANVSDLDDLKALAEQNQVAEISLINRDGIIERSSDPKYIGFDMHSGTQSSEFLCLLNGTKEFVQKYGPISSDGGQTLRKYAAVATDYGFLQVGYDAEQLRQDISQEVIGITQNRHVGKTGYILIGDENLNLVSAPSGVSRPSILGSAVKIVAAPPDTTVELTINGSPVHARVEKVEGYYLISVLPEAEAVQTRNIALYVNAFMEILVFAMLFAMIYMLIKKVVVNQIKSINSSLSRITEGNLDEVVDVRSNQEFASLSDDINTTVDTLKRYIAEASARLDAELEFAKNIQMSALPNQFPAFPKRKDFDIFASMDPAKEVGGDFYDFYLTGSDTLHFLVADVSGKGIPAAMFMMRAKTELKTLTEAEMPIDQVFTMGNHALCDGNDAGMFVTAWQGDLDLTNGLVRFANAGHNPPLVYHAGGQFEYLRSRAGFVLAGMDGIPYKAQELQLQPGDVVFLYTDGVTEATNAANELFGEDRLLEAVNACDFHSMQELCGYVKTQVDLFVGDAPQFDDITMVALHYFGAPATPAIRKEAVQLSDIPEISEFVKAELEKIGCSMKTIFQIDVVIDEICSNIVKFAYPDQPGPVTVKVSEKENPRRVCVRFLDEGIPYNPLIREDPDVTLSAEERDIGGLGIFLVKKTMDNVSYKYENGQNILTIQKNLE